MEKNWDTFEMTARGTSLTAAFHGKYVIARCRDAGVHIGYLKYAEGREAILEKARRLWRWEGAFDLNQIATDAPLNATETKFTREVPVIAVMDACELLPVSEVMEKRLRALPEAVV